MRSIVILLSVIGSLVAFADISPVRVVDNDADVSACKFLGQINAVNGLLQTKSVNKILQGALQEAAKAGAATAIVRKSSHSGVMLDAYKCGH